MAAKSKTPARRRSGASAKAQVAAAKQKARMTAARAKKRYEEGEVQFGIGVLVGGAAAGALSGYDMGLEVGETDIGAGLLAGPILVLADGFGNKLVKGAGYGMLAGEIALFVDDWVGDMFADEDEDELDEGELDDGDAS